MEEKNTDSSPNQELDKEKDFILDSLSDNISETHNNAEPGLENLNVVNEKYNEELVKELQDCLPIWVSQDQVLDLLTRSSGYVVEAVSDFYERETEYHDQVIAFRANAASAKSGTVLSQIKAPTILVPKLVSEKVSSNGSVKSSSSQEMVKKRVDVVKSVGSPMKRGSLRSTLFPKRKGSIKSTTYPQKKDSSKSTISPNKKVSAIGLQSSPKKKKGKPSTAMQPTNGSKQSTITNFFTKL
ncbi:DNA ligase 6-like [Papaver somniferum]|uniref:DNA ligase 6-like n=1 Tax=Papaver somniferum TaxID=3469 RepID=UPI000E6F539B|nr:DNA ligase 6-like [Papaver somniferum]